MKKTKFILCAIFCVTCAAAADNQKAAEQPVDLGKLFTAFGKLSLSSMGKGLSYGYSKLRPTSFTDGFVKALLLNNIAWATPKLLSSLRSKSNLVSHAISLPFSALATKLVAGKMSELLGQGKKQSARDTLYLQACLGTFIPIHSKISDIVSTLLKSDKIDKVKIEEKDPNEQFEAARSKFLEVLKIEKPEASTKEDIDEALRNIELSCEKEISDFAKTLKNFNPFKADQNLTLTMTGPTSTGKSYKMELIKELARKLGFKTCTLPSKLQEGTYVKVAGDLLEWYGNELAKAHDNGEKILFFVDEAFEDYKHNTTGDTSNQDADLTRYIDKTRDNKIPGIFGTNKSFDELSPMIQTRLGKRGKTGNNGFVVETEYPNNLAIATAFEKQLISRKNIFSPTLSKTSKLIGEYLDTCDLGVVFDTFKNIINKHSKKNNTQILIDIDSPASLDIIIPELELGLQTAIGRTKNILEKTLRDQSVVQEKREMRAEQISKWLNKYKANYGGLVYAHHKLIIKNAFITSKTVDELVKKIETIDRVINLPKKDLEKEEKKKDNEKKIEEKLEINEKKEEKKDDSEKIELKEKKGVPEKLNGEKKDSNDIKTENISNIKNDIKTLLTRLAALQDPSELVKLFEEHVGDKNAKNNQAKEQKQRYELRYLEQARNLVNFYEQTFPDGKFAMEDWRMNSIIKIADALKKQNKKSLSKGETEEYIFDLQKDIRYTTQQWWQNQKASVKKTAQYAATVGYNASYYTALVNILPLISDGYSSLSSRFRYSKPKDPDYSATVYSNLLGTLATQIAAPKQKALAHMLSAMIPEPARLPYVVGTLISKDKLNKDEYAFDPCGNVLIDASKINKLKKYTDKPALSLDLCKVTNEKTKKTYININQFAKNVGGYVSKKGEKKS